jgi:hypothetical protein
VHVKHEQALPLILSPLVLSRSFQMTLLALGMSSRETVRPSDHCYRAISIIENFIVLGIKKLANAEAVVSIKGFD